MEDFVSKVCGSGNPQQAELIPALNIPTVNLLLDEQCLTVVNSSEIIEKSLVFTERKFGKDPRCPWKKKTFNIRTEMFSILSDSPRTIQTWPGFWKQTIEILKGAGVPFKLHDLRLPFTKPRFDLMHGFRCKQKELLVEALNAGCSGLIGAPTRYGKSRLLLNAVRAWPTETIVVTVPGIDLVKQLYEEVKEAVPGRKVVLMGAGSRVRYPSEDVTVCSMDSLHKCDTGRTRLLLIDEPHSAVTSERLPLITAFKLARKYGFGATLDGRFDGRDDLIEGIIGPVLVNRTFTEGVAEGAICMIVVYMIKINFDPFNVGDHDAAYKKLLWQNPDTIDCVSALGNQLIPPDWQSLLFIKNEAQADRWAKAFSVSSIAMAKKLSKEEREQLLADMKADKIKRCIASDIYSQGVTFNHVRAMINGAGGGANVSAIQKPGRLAEIRPGKKCGVVFDFLFECNDPDLEPYKKRRSSNEWLSLVSESNSRMKAYQDKGYEVHVIDDWKTMADHFNKRCL